MKPNETDYNLMRFFSRTILTPRVSITGFGNGILLPGVSLEGGGGSKSVSLVNVNRLLQIYNYRQPKCVSKFYVFNN